MPLYFLVLEGAFFEQRLRPALSAAWQQRQFAPCRTVCAELLPRAQTFAQRYHISDEPLLQQILQGLPFDRAFWRHLVGELLWFSADEIPELQTTPETLCCLAAPEQYRNAVQERNRFAPIQQVFFGSRDLNFGGGFYHPDRAGYNNVNDVQRLSEYLQHLQPERWTVADLAAWRESSATDERADELAFVCEWLPPLQELYQRASAQQRVVVCEWS